MNRFSLELQQALPLIELAATAAFALSGLVEAARKRLDIVGVMVVCFLASFGGGTLRDLLLDQRPFFWVKHPEFVWGILLMSLSAMLWLRLRHIQPTERAIQIPDALGLGLYAGMGTAQALNFQMPALIAVMMGVITGVFGGVLRDIVCNEIPNAFRDHRPYAVLAFAGGWIYIGLTQQLGLSDSWATGLTVAWVAGVRGLAVIHDWQLPRWRMHED